MLIKCLLGKEVNYETLRIFRNLLYSRKLIPERTPAESGLKSLLHEESSEGSWLLCSMKRIYRFPSIFFFATKIFQPVPHEHFQTSPFPKMISNPFNGSLKMSMVPALTDFMLKGEREGP